MKRLFCIVLTIYLALACTACSPVPNARKASEGLPHYAIEATYDANGTLSGHLEYTFVNDTDNVLDSREFLLYGVAFRKDAHTTPIEPRAFYCGESYGDMHVDRVTVNGTETETSLRGDDGEILCVPLPALYPESGATIGMDFSLSLARVNHRLGITEHSVNLGNWYPTASVYSEGTYRSYPYYANGDPFYTEAANYDVELTVPNDWQIAASGRGTVADNTHTFRTYAQRDFAAVLYPDASIRTAAAGDTQITYLFYDDADPDASMRAACDALSYFAEEYGDYPYDSFCVAETGFLEGGMEYPGLVLISDAAKESYIEVVIHETAHQWWYGLVGSNPVLHAWQDEGLTEFSTTMFYDTHPDYGQSRTDRIMKSMSAYLVYVDVYESINGTVDTSMDRSVDEFRSAYEYTYMTYVKGELLFDTLYTQIGDKKFRNGLREYFRAKCYGLAEPADLIAAFERASGRELASFFDAWLDGKVVIA